MSDWEDLKDWVKTKKIEEGHGLPSATMHTMGKKSAFTEVLEHMNEIEQEE